VNERSDVNPAKDASYSPRVRTALVLCGAGTAGAYQAGVLRALTEAGVKLDVVAGHGPGAGNALCAAIDGSARLWDAEGPWMSPSLHAAYRWRGALRVFFIGLIATAILLVSPLLVLVAAAATYAIGLALALINLTEASAAVVGVYQRMIELLFNPPVLPTILPRAMLLTLLVVVSVLVVSAVRAAVEERSRRRFAGGVWWRLLGAPLGADEPGHSLSQALWTLVRGASSTPVPKAEDVGRRYVEVLTDNLGQPGFREVLVAVHDVDSRRDLIGAILAPQARGRFEARRSGGGPREAEIVDFSGPQRNLALDFLLGALRVPVANAPWPVQFPADGYWRGELHHVCDRPELPIRLLEEIAAIGVDQVVLVSPAPSPSAPHTLRSRPAAFRSRLGADVRSIETAAFDDTCAVAAARFSGVFVIRPDHNPIGPFDFSGVYDDASDRQCRISELMQQGYDDAYRSFIEPVVAAGERLVEI
jgi:hypothetical protein